MRAITLCLAVLATPATPQESFYTTAEQAQHRAGAFEDQDLFNRRDQLLPGQCDIQPGSGLAQVTRFAIDAQQDGFLPALRVPCSMSIRNFHDVAFVEDGPSLRPLVAEVPVIEIGTDPNGLPDWSAARIEGFAPSPILADFEIDLSGTHAWFSVPQALSTETMVSVKVALPSMAILTVTLSGREGSESMILLDNRP